ncbi:hypothetical protein [Kingella potus]|uniref:hypothetical protein n=1 Tax=Kingella potus TaxID=265175 RepID=UPI001FCFF3E1|nr:hypothetical protein [Kingella potus]UOP01261.1 hypothetical protein LVJ84_03090 [Kingella potus]
MPPKGDARVLKKRQAANPPQDVPPKRKKAAAQLFLIFRRPPIQKRPPEKTTAACVAAPHTLRRLPCVGCVAQRRRTRPKKPASSKPAAGCAAQTQKKLLRSFFLFSDGLRYRRGRLKSRTSGFLSVCQNFHSSDTA